MILSSTSCASTAQAHNHGHHGSSCCSSDDRQRFNNTAQYILSQPKKLRDMGGGKYSALCPCHDDHNHSLSITITDVWIGLHCHAGCDFFQLCDGFGVRSWELRLQNGDSPRPSGKGRHAAPKVIAPQMPTVAKAPEKNELHEKIKRWAKPALRFHANELARLLHFPKHLGQSILDAFTGLRFAHIFGKPAWLFPMEDGHGNEVGLAARFRKGSKKSYGRLGIFVPTHSTSLDENGPVYLPEGASDTISLIVIKLNAVGRPSNMAGVIPLAAQFANFPKDRAIVVIGERDQKPDGSWPGRDGAERTAQKLANLLGRTIRVIYPPGDAKDSRAYVTAALASGRDPVAIAEDFRACLNTAEVFRPESNEVDADAEANFQRDLDLLATTEADVVRDERWWRVPTIAEMEEAFASSPEGIDDAYLKSLQRAPGCGGISLLGDNPDKPADVLTVCLRCQAWACSFCRVLNSRDWAKAMGEHFSRCPVIYTSEVFADDCTNVTEAITKRDGSYVTVVQWAGVIKLFSSIPTRDSRELHPAQALQEFVSSLESIPQGVRRPVNASRLWRLAKERNKKYHYLGQVGRDSRDYGMVAKIFEGLGIETKTLQKTSRGIERGFFSRLPPEYRSKRFFETLAMAIAMDHVPTPEAFAKMCDTGFSLVMSSGNSPLGRETPPESPAPVPFVVDLSSVLGVGSQKPPP